MKDEARREVSPYRRHVARVGVAELVRIVQRLAAQRAANHARAAEAIAELRNRPCMVAEEAAKQPMSHLTASDVTGSEVAAALGWTAGQARQSVLTAVALDERMFATMARLEAGELEWEKVQVIASQAVPLADHTFAAARAAGLSPREAEAAARAIVARLEEMVLPTAAKLTRGRLERRVEEAIARLDPPWAEERRLRSTRGRSVSAPARSNGDPEGQGMSDVFAHLPAPEAQAIWNTVDAYARAMRTAGDERTLEELRADTLTHLILRGHPPTDLHVTTPTPDAAEPTPAPTSAPASTSAPAPTPGPASAFPTPAPAPSSAPTPAAASAFPVPAPATATASAAPTSAPAPARVAAPSPTPVDARPEIDWARTSGFDRYGLRANIDVVVSLETLMGISDAPGELVGHGPITAQVARDIAFKAGGTWRRLVVDQVGRLVDRGRDKYVPPDALKQFVRARDRSCRTPWCDRPAGTCDVDHVKPFPAGPTAAENLQCKCRRCHRLKHEGHWRHEVLEDGTIRMLSPAGIEYFSEPVDLRPIPLPRASSKPVQVPDRGAPPF